MKRQKPDMRRERWRASIRKKQIAREVEAEYGIKSTKKKTALLKIKEEQDQGQEYFEDEGSFYLINAHGGVSSAGRSSASGVHAPTSSAPHPASAAPPRPTSRATRTAPSRTAPPA